MSLRTFDMYLGTCVVGTETALAGRVNSGLVALVPANGEEIKVKGIFLGCANTGYLVARKNNAHLSAMGSLACTNPQGMIPLEETLKNGDQLTLHYNSQSGTAACEATIVYDTNK